MGRLVLTLLGGFQARLEPGGVVGLPTRKAQALLAYLALPPGQAHSRDKLAALLWGGIRDESARASLRQALFGLRRALGGTPALRQEGDALALDPDVTDVDVAAFASAVREGTRPSLERAALLYTGDLLAGLVIDEPAFEEWLLGERERLRELALEALARLLAQQRRAGAMEPAVATALRLLNVDPLQEVVHRALMRCYAALGRRGAALRQYQQCVNVLGRELGIEPEAETKALYQEILRQRSVRPAVSEPVLAAVDTPGTVTTARSPMAEIALIGRRAELEQLRTALKRAQSGQGSAMAVIGEAGMGKTRLVGELIAEAEQEGTRVLVGRSYESEQVLPFGPWVGALRAPQVLDDLVPMAAAWRAELAHLLPELAGGDTRLSPGSPDVLRLFEGVRGAVAALAGRRPLLLVLEDLHWADEMSARLLGFVGRRLASLPVLVVVTAREEELAESAMLRRVLDELARERRLSALTLAGLSRDDTLALVHTLAHAGADATVLARLGAAAWQASAGNPFVVVETVRSRAQGIDRLAESVRQLVASRLERLSERGRLLATVAAVIGREFEFALLRHAAGLEDAEAAEGVEELVRRRVLHGVGERFDFTHDRIREVADAEVLAPRRRMIHRSVAEAIEAVHAGGLDAHVLALGLHHQGAEMWPEAMRYLRRAAGQAFAQAAYREAATCLERALASAAHLPPTPDILDEMLDLQLQLRNALWPLAEFDRIERCLLDSEALAGSLRDRGRQGKIAAFTSVLRWITGDAAAARTQARRARDAASALADRQLQVMANYYLGLAHHLLGEYRQAEDAYLENVRMLTPDEPDPLGVPGSTLARSACWLVLPLAERGDFSTGLAHGRAALDMAEAASNPYDVVSASYCLAYLHCLRGALDLAIPLLERALAICRDRDINNWLPQVTGYLGHAYSRTGRLDEGLALLERAIDVYEATRAWPFRALLTVHRGAACVLAGRLDAAEALGREALGLARQHGERGHEAWALRLLGSVAAQRKSPDVEQGERHYGDALALAEQLEMRPLTALCHRELAALHDRAGDGPRAREHRLAAAALDRDLGMDQPVAS